MASFIEFCQLIVHRAKEGTEAFKGNDRDQDTAAA